MLTYNLQLSTSINDPVVILCQTLIHSRVCEADPGYGQSSFFYKYSALVTKPYMM